MTKKQLINLLDKELETVKKTTIEENEIDLESIDDWMIDSNEEMAIYAKGYADALIFIKNELLRGAKQ